MTAPHLLQAGRALVERVRLRAFMAAADGVAAVEFAMLLPLLVLLYLGMTEMTYAVNADHRLTSLARTLADLTGRQLRVTSGTPGPGETAIESIFNAGFAVMQPYKVDDPSGPLSMTISSIAVKATGATTGNPPQPVLEGKVCWSEGRLASGGALQKTGAPALTPGATVPVPLGFRTANTSFVRADVNLAYKPLFGSTILRWITGDKVGAITLQEQTPWPVRNTTEVVMSGVAACLT